MTDKERAKWQKEAKEVATRTISAISERIHAYTWEKRCAELHPAVTKALDRNLKNITAKYKECVLVFNICLLLYKRAVCSRFSQRNTKFYSLAMLTFDDNGKSCTNTYKNSVHGTHEHVTYLVQPFSGSEDSVNATRHFLQGSKTSSTRPCEFRPLAGVHPMINSWQIPQ